MSKEKTYVFLLRQAVNFCRLVGLVYHTCEYVYNMRNFFFVYQIILRTI